MMRRDQLNLGDHVAIISRPFIGRRAPVSHRLHGAVGRSSHRAAGRRFNRRGTPLSLLCP